MVWYRNIATLIMVVIAIVCCPAIGYGAVYPGTISDWYAEFGDTPLEMIKIDGDIYDYDQMSNGTGWKVSWCKNGVEVATMPGSIVPSQPWPCYMVIIPDINNVYHLKGKVYYPPNDRWVTSDITCFDGSAIVGNYFVDGVPEQSQEEFIQNKMVIWWPPYDGYKFSTSVQSIQYQWGLPTGSSMSVSINGVISSKVMERKIIEQDGWLYGTYKDEIQLQVGENTVEITVNVGGKSVTGTRIVEVLAGQVDEDGDGLDDRTGMPIWPDDPVNWGSDGPPQLPGEGGTIFDYIKWFADSVLYSVGQVVTMIKGFMSGIGQISRLFGEIFKWVPSELIAIMILGLCMTVVLRVLGR